MNTLRNEVVRALFTLALGLDIIARYLAGVENDKTEYEVSWFGHKGWFC